MQKFDAAAIKNYAVGTGEKKFQKQSIARHLDAAANRFQACGRVTSTICAVPSHFTAAPKACSTAAIGR